MTKHTLVALSFLVIHATARAADSAAAAIEVTTAVDALENRTQCLFQGQERKIPSDIWTSTGTVLVTDQAKTRDQCVAAIEEHVSRRRREDQVSTLVSSQTLRAAPSVFRDVEASEEGQRCLETQLEQVNTLIAPKTAGLRTLQRLGVKHIHVRLEENRTWTGRDQEVPVGFEVDRQWMHVYAGFSQEDGFCGTVSARSIRTTLVSDNADLETLEDLRPKQEK